ncbi:hypothetical protein CBR_g6715 [Chara braunii]|uniref:Nucleolus and neural progenitor protein-like N-terminal domain-containing protein n=1 Tax=Chara braunii TaxID=69332 RepID=A0A388KKL8_CHABU|nr:hypothetical protein CBR_g6715 [Chara braunii]|eukprot:GBG70589.1 hypothetical protein CBR_g6715 [Chara braunii]
MVQSSGMCSLEECAEKLRQPSLWAESTMFDRILYKNNNQHRCTLYFQRLRAVRQGMNLLRKVGLHEHLQDLCIKLRSRPDASSCSSSPSDEEYAQVQNVLKRLWAGAKLMSRINRAALIAAARVATLLASQTFGRMAAIAFGCLSRFHVLLCQMICDTVPAYNLLLSTATERGFDLGTLLEDPKLPPCGHLLDAERLPVKLEEQVSKPESVGVKAVFDSTRRKPRAAGGAGPHPRGVEQAGRGGSGGRVGPSQGRGDGGPNPSRGRGDGDPHPSRGSGDGGDQPTRGRGPDGESGNYDGSAANPSCAQPGRGEKRRKRTRAAALRPSSEAKEHLADGRGGLRQQENEAPAVAGQQAGSNDTRASTSGTADDTPKKRKVVTPVARSGGKRLGHGGHLPRDWRFLEKDG